MELELPHQPPRRSDGTERSSSASRRGRVRRFRMVDMAFSLPGEKGAWPVHDDSTAVLQGQLERALTGDAEARQVELPDERG
jgi:hypothetical protein